MDVFLFVLFIQYDEFLLYFKFSISFFRSFINSPIGVIITKKIIIITSGDTIFPKKIPNLNHNLLKGVKRLEFIVPRIKNIITIIDDQTLI